MAKDDIVYSSTLGVVPALDEEVGSLCSAEKDSDEERRGHEEQVGSAQ